jgi:tRNA threonylcarbamoyladenosine biosynthesis protein TsaE
MMAAQKHDHATSVSLPDPAATQAFAARLARIVQPGDVIALIGDLGMGKTAFARGFVNALATLHGLPEEEVPSPTFTLVQTYPLPDFTVYHIDLYRLEDPAEALELGIEDAFADDVSLIEWPDRLGPLLPADRLDICFLPGETGDAREVQIIVHGEQRSWLDRLDEQVLDA